MKKESILMQTAKQKVDVNIAYIGGGSRGWAWGFMSDLAQQEFMQGSIRLYDIDRDAARANETIGGRMNALPDAKSSWAYSVADSLRDALTGADFVVISILPGTFTEMQSDVHLPEAYGIWQSVGDTTGPGGMIRALRTVPMFAEIGEAVKAYAPDAWVINYTNPMSVCVQTLYEVFPQIKAFGCCHEVFGTQELLSDMLLDMQGIEGIRRQDIHVNVLGINHFTWFDKATWQGEDLLPLFAQFAEKYYAGGYIADKEHWLNSNSTFICAHRVKFELFRKYGLIAAAGDRHLAEFMPDEFLRSPEAVKAWMFALTPVSWRVEDLQRRLARSRALVDGSEEITLRRSGEEGHLLIRALLGADNGMVSNVIVPNRGQIPNLPLGASVETNALFRANSIAPVMAGPLPDNLLPLVARHVYNNTNILRAALACDYDLALSTFQNDPMVHIATGKSEAMFDQMVKNTLPYLPEKWAELLASK